MRKLLSYAVFVVFILILFSMPHASAAIDIPRIEPYVNDFAGLLSPDEELQLNLLADNIENSTTFEIAIVTVTGTGGEERLQFANKIGDQNGVGKKDTDNGIVVLWSVDDDKGGAIATGRGSESFINDAVTGRIGRAAREYFDRGEFYAGMNYIVTELNKVIVEHQTVPVSTYTPGSSSDDLPEWFWPLVIVGIFTMLFIVIVVNATDNSDSYSSSGSYSSSDDDKGYYRRQVYKRHGKWYNPKTYRSYDTAAAAAVALALANDPDDDDDDDSSSSSSSGSSFRGGSFGGGSFGGGGSSF